MSSLFSQDAHLTVPLCVYTLGIAADVPTGEGVVVHARRRASGARRNLGSAQGQEGSQGNGQTNGSKGGWVGVAVVNLYCALGCGSCFRNFVFFFAHFLFLLSHEMESHMYTLKCTH